MEDKSDVSAARSSREKNGLAAAPLDFAGCLEMLGGDRGTVLRLLRDFLLDLDRQLEVLAGAVAGGHPEVIRRAAHSIKGGAAVLSAHSLMAAAAVLEEHGKSGEVAKGEAGLSALAGEVARLRRYCQELTRGII